jgi:hypothetical protein
VARLFSSSAIRREWEIGLSLFGRRVFRVFGQIAVTSGFLDVTDVFGNGHTLEMLQFLLNLFETCLGDWNFFIKTPIFLLLWMLRAANRLIRPVKEEKGLRRGSKSNQ